MMVENGSGDANKAYKQDANRVIRCYLPLLPYTIYRTHEYYALFSHCGLMYCYISTGNEQDKAKLGNAELNGETIAESFIAHRLQQVSRAAPSRQVD